MENEELQTGIVHHGHNIGRVRRMKGIKQLGLANMMNISQQSISRYESLPEIDEITLRQFAKALEVPVEYLKVAEENAPAVIFESNSVTNNNEAEGSYSSTNLTANTGEITSTDSSTKTFNPMEKVVELYERLLSGEKERYDALEKRMLALEQKQGQ